MSDIHLGVDIGGSGMKAAPVDLVTGRLTEDRLRVRTPQPATPPAVADVVAELVEHFSWTDPIGVTFPAVVKDGVTMTAANVDPSWIGCDAATLLSSRTGCPVHVGNDADAAGVAEMAFGAGRGRAGVVLMVTLGTGIGSALFVDGTLVPNTELGHLSLRGKDAEQRAAASVRDRKKLSWRAWAKRVNEYLQHVETVLSPDLIIIGGGVSRNHEKFVPYLDLVAPVVPASLENNAGIVGAALAAPTPARKTTAGKTSARKTTARKATPRKAATRKTTARKTTARKTAPGQATRRPRGG